MPCRCLALVACLLVLATGVRAQEDVYPLVATLEGHGAHVPQARISENGDYLVSVSHDCSVRLWSTRTWEELCSLSIEKSQLWTAVFSPDGRYLAAAGDFIVRVWAVPKKAMVGKEWKQVADLPIDGEFGKGKGSAMSLAFSPDSKTLMVGSMNSAIMSWQVKSWKALPALEGHEGCDGAPGFIEFLAFSPDGKLLLSGGKTPATRIWKTDKRGKSWTCDQVFKEKKRKDSWPTHRMMGEFSPDGKFVAIGGTDGFLQVMETENWKEVLWEQTHPAEFVSAMAFSADGKSLFTAGKTIKIHDTTTWKSRDLKTLSSSVAWLSVSPDGKWLVEVGMDFKIRVRGLQPQ